MFAVEVKVVNSFPWVGSGAMWHFSKFYSGEPQLERCNDDDISLISLYASYTSFNSKFFIIVNLNIPYLIQPI